MRRIHCLRVESSCSLVPSGESRMILVAGAVGSWVKVAGKTAVVGEASLPWLEVPWGSRSCRQTEASGAVAAEVCGGKSVCAELCHLHVWAPCAILPNGLYSI